VPEEIVAATHPTPTSVTPPVAPEPTQEEGESFNIDWISVGLGLLALAAVGGLVPWWIYIYLTWTNPLP
jgi:serine/threonine-protein kinase